MSRRRIVLIVVIVGILALAASVYLFVDPASSRLFPKCPFYLLTGLKCPGCGSQRALHQLLHLNLAQAIHYNALLVASIPLLVFLGTADVLRFRHPRLYRAARNPILSWSILAVVLLWWLLRNIFGW